MNNFKQELPTAQIAIIRDALISYERELNPHANTHIRHCTLFDISTLHALFTGKVTVETTEEAFIKDCGQDLPNYIGKPRMDIDIDEQVVLEQLLETLDYGSDMRKALARAIGVDDKPYFDVDMTVDDPVTVVTLDLNSNYAVHEYLGMNIEPSYTDALLSENLFSIDTIKETEDMPMFMNDFIEAVINKFTSACYLRFAGQ